jgi:hypothetical protein
MENSTGLNKSNNTLIQFPNNNNDLDDYPSNVDGKFNLILF